MKDTVIFYKDWFTAIEQMPIEMQLDVYQTIFRYAFEGITPDNPVIMAVTALMRSAIDRANEKYRIKCEINRLNGRKGGAPLGNKNAAKNIDKEIVAKQPKISETTKTTERLKNQPKQADNDNDNDNDNDKLLLEPKGSLCDSDEPHSALRQKPLIDVKSFIQFFNAEMEKEKAIVKRVVSISGTRKTALMARAKEYGKEAVAEVVRKTARSSFMNGNNDRGWVASFDWIMRPNNFPKVLEGEYDNDKRNAVTAQHNDTKHKDRYRDRRGADSEARSAEDYTDTI